MKIVADYWLLIQFTWGQYVEVSQKPSMARGKRASHNLSAPEPAVLHQTSSAFKGPRRSSPILKVGFSNPQRSSNALGYLSELIKKARPRLRPYGTLVNPFNEFRIHGLLVPPQRWNNRRIASSAALGTKSWATWAVPLNARAAPKDRGHGPGRICNCRSAYTSRG